VPEGGTSKNTSEIAAKQGGGGGSQVTGEWLYTAQVPTNDCGVPTDKIWIVVRQRTTSSTTYSSSDSWTADGYGYVDNGTYTLTNPPAGNGNTYRVTYSRQTSYVRNSATFINIKSDVKKYTVLYLNTGVGVSWTEEFPNYVPSRIACF
jgi:hypothetical protein